MYLIEQIQYLFVCTLATFNRYAHVSYNTIADRLDQTVLYTVHHNINRPQKKTYTSSWLPYIRVTIDLHNLLETSIGQTNDVYGPCWFYHNCVIFNRTMCYFFGPVPIMKPLSDYTKLAHIGMSVGTQDSHVDVSNMISRMYSCIPLTASHICTFFDKSCEHVVQVIDRNCDEITFKGSDRVN